MQDFSRKLILMIKKKCFFNVFFLIIIILQCKALYGLFSIKTFLFLFWGFWSPVLLFNVIFLYNGTNVK